MNGSRSPSPNYGDRTSLDALSRTIEGLEARIEGLMGSAAREQGERARQTRDVTSGQSSGSSQSAGIERQTSAAPHTARPIRESTPRHDPLAEIRQRQRALEASRERANAARSSEPTPPHSREAFVHRPATQRQQLTQGHVASDAMAEIAQALVSLRQDLKQDISEGITREMNALRAEMRDIKASAQDRQFADDVREDLGRLADSINQLAGHNPHPETAGLRAEFEELRSLMDGLARDEALRGMEARWDGFEDKLHSLDTAGLQEELVSLAYRLDDIKRELGGMGEGPAVRILEQKLIAMATAMEQLGSLMQPHERAMTEQFAAVDTRLDEISRAIAANSRMTSASSDASLVQRLESRLAGLADQIELMGRSTQDRQRSDDLGTRIEALTLRIDEMTNAAAATRLEERLDELAHLMQRSQRVAQPELGDALADISRKIDALEQGSVNGELAERLDYLARRIDTVELHGTLPAPVMDENAIQRLEGRLSDIATRLEESVAAPPADPQALRNLEEQIAHLSVLMSEPRHTADTMPADFDRRMSAIEDYMATNDEYIIEAARQAAEAVVEAYSRNRALTAAAPADMSALTALAEDLRHLEDLSRGSEERTQKTFQALHETLVHIADRLDHMESRSRPARMPASTADFEVDPFAHAEAAPAARELQASTSTQTRPAPVVEPQQMRDPDIASNPIIAEPARPGDKPTGKKSSGTSLLAGLGKRFRPKRKQEAPSAERAMIDSAPSIDPVDVMPPEAANEPLEPGSGAPDVKKILERVRASQNALRAGGGKIPTEGDRADYIAAARRAAQAAAMEIDQTRKISAAPGEKQKPSGKGFSRYRRPILLAVGAILLAVMAFPLVNTLTRGEKAPEPAAVSALTSAANPPTADDDNLAPQDQASATAGAEGTIAGSTDIDVSGPPPASQPAAETAPIAASLTEPASLGGDSATLAPAGTPAQETSTFAPSDTGPSEAPAAAEARAVKTAPAADVIVPDTIQPKSMADAARSGDPLALFEIGARFTEGRGVPADLKQAAAWYQLSADKGFAPAQYRIANMYEKGNGLDRDLAKAKEYYELAADQGNASAMHNLAVLYASGNAGGEQDYTAAATWFAKAADLGVTDSQFNLAILYARGNGVKQDLEESYKWFSIAAKNGDKDAAQKRDEVANAMKPDQVERARAKADLWKPQPLDNKANAIEVPDEWAGTGTKTASIDMKKAIRNIQAILNNNGFDAGPPDGEMGAKTVAAIKGFQKSIGQEPTGKVNDSLVKELLARNK
ncbi:MULTISPECIES: peptidoglycan-binding protein [unclassified Sinorhizobium]|uniref:peptidoglycan-binding protein n=1 Tax=unclassified Sinorhizobium TaxID=2613772 RepID=UPI003524BDC1